MVRLCFSASCHGSVRSAAITCVEYYDETSWYTSYAAQQVRRCQGNFHDWFTEDQIASSLYHPSRSNRCKALRTAYCVAFQVALPTALWSNAWLELPHSGAFFVWTYFPSGDKGSVEPGLYSPVAVFS